VEQALRNAVGSLDFARDDEGTRGLDPHGHRGYEPGALREERNEAVLKALSRGSRLNRPAQAIR
jgi:hypothetical protein